MKKFICLFLLLSIFLIPKYVFADELLPNAKSGMLIEASSGKIFYEKERDLELPVASMTKMVAQIIILENLENGNIKLDDIVKVSKNAASMGGSQIYIYEGEEISVEDLLKGISVASGNDATVAMAEYIAGSEENFVKLMNKKVKDLGLKHTNFKNCTGLDEDGHYSSAYDMAMIARDLVINHPKILEYSSIYEDYLRENSDNPFWLVNTNKLIRFYDGADGLKTGHTDNAGYCLAATAKRNNVRLIAIALGESESKVRNSEVMSLLDYGFNNVYVNTLKSKSEVIKKVKVDKADKEIISITLLNDLNVVEDVNNKNKKYTYKTKINDIELPLKNGDIVGKIDAYYKDKKVSSSNLTIIGKVNKISFLSLYKKTFIDIITGVY